jgi:hypothetical protein
MCQHPLCLLPQQRHQQAILLQSSLPEQLNM